MSDYGSAVELRYGAIPEIVEVKPVSLAGAERFRLREAKLDRLTQLGDLTLIWLCLWVAVRSYAWHAHWTLYDSAAAATASALFYLVGCARHLYRAQAGGVGAKSALATFKSLSICWGCVVAPLLTAGFMTKTSSVYSRVAMLGWFSVTPFVLFGFRALVSAWQRSSRSGPRRVAVVGAGRLGCDFAAQITSGKANGLSLLGIYDERTSERDDTSAAVSGTVADLLAAARGGGVDAVYIALPLSAEQRIGALIRTLQDSMVSVYLALDVTLQRADGSARLEAIGNVLVSPVTFPTRSCEQS